MTDVCTWTQDPWAEYSQLWWPSCGGEPWELTDGTPIENKMKFCPFCGKPLVQKEREP